MSVDFLPDIPRPVLVKVMWVFNKENVIRINLEVAVFLRAYRHRILLAVQGKTSHHLSSPRSLGRNIRYHVLYSELLQWRQRSRLMRKVCLATLPIKWIVSKLITKLHPNRLFRQLMCRLQIIRTQLLGRNVIVRLQRRFDLGRRVGLPRLVPFVDNVSRAPARKHDGGHHKDLQSFLKLRINRHDLRMESHHPRRYQLNYSKFSGTQAAREGSSCPLF